MAPIIWKQTADMAPPGKRPNRSKITCSSAWASMARHVGGRPEDRLQANQVDSRLESAAVTTPTKATWAIRGTIRDRWEDECCRLTCGFRNRQQLLSNPVLARTTVACPARAALKTMAYLNHRSTYVKRWLEIISIGRRLRLEPQAPISVQKVLRLHGSTVLTIAGSVTVSSATIDFTSPRAPP
jgi:hypothetical protein